MKSIIAGLVTLTALSLATLAFAGDISQDVGDLRQDQNGIRQDRQDIHQDRRDLWQDRQNTWQDRGNLVNDRQQLRQDVRSGNRAGVATDRANLVPGPPRLKA